eukprot:2464-Eustigmatos_ZCMA.PRE.1
MCKKDSRKGVPHRYSSATGQAAALWRAHRTAHGHGVGRVEGAERRNLREPAAERGIRRRG